MSEPYLALQVVMMPKDANPHPTPFLLPDGTTGTLFATIFGGVILSNIDIAGSIAARREIVLRGGQSGAQFVTVAVNRVEFKHPVLVGDVVKFLASCVRIGRTSITMHIDVVAERGNEVFSVTEAEVVYVGVRPVGADRQPVLLLPSATPPGPEASP
ncbi:acyl-CoA thioesterase [Limnoglobus roseus]|uniref:Acyl-CoA thioesterase n=1 Tax=Limnoglobus roseus TaxID=2598579 RepID=A0A5C1AHP0_9BACT|nr:hotdog domain-containing protein [Limnoglobus roseus]QEL18350.1 acyl-CoA thioesterase [Limnoglobus roseus]